ncbi:MAG: T9SS type A sorting domain-containing protein [Bacteroidales bacterium]|nr:T9SS type A sorting domain-containing protein [Bacteroidales bacterium]
MKKISILLFILFYLLTSYNLFGQVSLGGLPPSFSEKDLPDEVMIYKLPSLDLQQIANEDAVDNKNGNPYRYAVGLDVDLKLDNSGTWTELGNGDRIWRLKIVSTGALAVGIYYRVFYLPPGAELFLYNEAKTQILGAYTSNNNKENGAFATELIEGEILCLEYYEPFESYGKGVINISEIAHAYRSVNFLFHGSDKDFGDSDFCEININCPEGNNWLDEKRGVARISVKMNNNSFWCTGSLLNNVRQDFTPYFLTADHCGAYATVIDFTQWIFYFSYEGPSCDDPVNEPVHHSVSGCKKRANGGSSGTTGSDFLLLELLEDIPDWYNVHFNGWNNSLTASDEGVTIHHPNGDIKKISTYTQTLTSSNWNGSSYQSHWKVYWATTTTGHGVTEGGSSGSPIFNKNGEIVGSLTGGAAACVDGGAGPGTGPDEPDYYGKFSYHWKSNGADPDERLKDWLDPDDTQVISLKGINIYPTPDFEASSTTIEVGNSVSFMNTSTGIPPDKNNTWFWEFEGGNPQNSTDENPQNIKYDSPGAFDVKLEVTLPDTTISITKTDYLHVIGDVIVFPNPSRDLVYIDMMGNNVAEIEIRVYNALGKEVRYYEIKSNVPDIIDLGSFIGLSSGIYYISVITPDFTKNLKLSLNK